MKVARNFILVILCLSLGFPSNAKKQRTTRDLLMDKTWQSFEKYEDGLLLCKFDACYLTEIDYCRPDDCTIRINRYYLSHNAEKEFDDQQVGKATEGRYLIIKDGESNPPRVYFIRGISENNFSMHHIPEHLILGSYTSYWKAANRKTAKFTERLLTRPVVR